MQCKGLNLQVPVVQKIDSADHWINHYPVDSDLSDGQHHPPFEQMGPDLKFKLLCNHTFTFICNNKTEGFYGNSTSLQYTKNNKFLKANRIMLYLLSKCI